MTNRKPLHNRQKFKMATSERILSYYRPPHVLRLETRGKVWCVVPLSLQARQTIERAARFEQVSWNDWMLGQLHRQSERVLREIEIRARCLMLSRPTVILMKIPA